MPIPEWNREYPRRVTSDAVPDPTHGPVPEADDAATEVEPERRRDGRDLLPGPLHHHPARPPGLPPAHRGTRQGPQDRARSSSRATTCRSSTRSRSPSPRRGPSTSSPKPSYFEGTGVSGWASREFFTAIGAVPVQRGAGQAALDALDQQRVLLEQGSAVALYPEGTRSLDGRLYKGRTGVAFLALQTGAPVVPVGLIGTDEVMPVGAKMPVASRTASRCGSASRSTCRTTARPTSGRARRLATDDIMAAIHALSGQELANAYNEVPAHTPIERIKQVLPHERR